MHQTSQSSCGGSVLVFAVVSPSLSQPFTNTEGCPISPHPSHQKEDLAALESSRELMGEMGSYYGSYNEDCLAPWGGWLGETHYPSISRLTKAYMKEEAIELHLEKEGDLNICIMERHTSKDFTQKHSVRKEIF